jgi:hypothetical protein
MTVGLVASEKGPAQLLEFRMHLREELFATKGRHDRKRGEKGHIPLLPPPGFNFLHHRG